MESAENEKIQIQIATPEDAEVINDIQYRAWMATYPNAKHGITIDDIESRFEDMSEERIARRRKSLENPDDGMTTLVARKDSKTVGMCRAITTNDRNQLQMIYVHPDYQHQGIGTRLWEEAKKHLEMAKDTYVDVVDYNQAAIDFYTKLGFAPSGRTHQDERFRLKSGAIFTEMEMVLRRTDSASRT